MIKVELETGAVIHTEVGVQGLPGAAGAEGTDGRTILNGSGAPASGLGDEGDFYIDTVAAEIYGPKTAGEWGAGTSLVGPEGPAGGDSHVPDPALEANGRSLEVLTGALVYTTQASKVGHTHTLTDVTDAGTAAAAASTDFATAGQGALADSAVQPEGATVSVIYDAGWPAERPVAATVLAVGHTAPPAWLTADDVWFEDVS